jgi:hypothetical protein
MKKNLFLLVCFALTVVSGFAQSDNFLVVTGDTDYMIVNNDAAFNITAGQSFSISLKVKSSIQTGGYRIIDHRDGTSNGYELATNSTGMLALNLKDNNNTGLGTSWGTTSINDGNWHHVVAVFDGTNKTTYLYVDGNKEGTKERPTTTIVDISPNVPLLFGIKDLAYNNPFVGMIDDVRFWNKALSKEEADADAISSVTNTTPGLIAAWDFESSSNNMVADITGNFTGELVNGAVLGDGGTTSAEDIFYQGIDVSVYPNPVIDVLNIKTSSGDGLAYQLIDLTGKILEQGKLNEEHAEISVSHLLKGTYLMTIVKNNQNVKVHKFIKE